MAQGYCDKDCKKVTEGQSRGRQFLCGVCGHYSTKDRQDPTQASSKFSTNGYTAEYVVSSEERISTLEDAIRVCKIDTNIWKIDKWEVGTHEGYRKDRNGWWKSEGGKVSGESFDSGKIVVVPLHSVRVWVSRKTEEIRHNMLTKELSNMLTKQLSTKGLDIAAKYPKLKYKNIEGGHLFELGLPDLQLGRLVAAEDAGQDVSPELQIKKADEVVDRLISYAGSFPVTRCLFPVGNDFFDTNTADMATAHGTPQQDDVRWKRTYKLGCEFIIRTAEKLMQIAPVDIVIVPGNHDEDKIWHLGEYIDAWFREAPDVSVDNRPMKRKYYSRGWNLVGLTHGYFEKLGKLDSLMAYEVPSMWAHSTNREWHLGDKHHKVDMVMKTEEKENGVVIRILRSLASPSVWEFDKGFTGSLHAGEAFVWHDEDGVVAQFTASK